MKRLISLILFRNVETSSPLETSSSPLLHIQLQLETFCDNRRDRLSAISWLPRGIWSLVNISSKMKLWMHLTVLKFNFEERNVGETQ